MKKFFNIFSYIAILLNCLLLSGYSHYHRVESWIELSNINSYQSKKLVRLKKDSHKVDQWITLSGFNAQKSINKKSNGHSIKQQDAENKLIIEWLLQTNRDKHGNPRLDFNIAENSQNLHNTARLDYIKYKYPLKPWNFFKLKP